MGVSEIVGVYDANGGLLGEAAYVWGKVRGTRHCGLCDITHGAVRRKAAWDRMAATLPVRVRLLHLNELDGELAAAVAATRAPVVLTRERGAWRELVGPQELGEMDGSVEAFEAAVRERLAGRSGTA